MLGHTTQITIDDLKKLANTKGKLRQSAQKVLTEALRKQRDGVVASIVIYRDDAGEKAVKLLN